ncbi:MAG: hypothetical protein LBU55_02655 [Elusimicrobiota bacterium]|jgi:hypothetical protein|nr:hypothetical protein [Elusimicrobiota bacterium]
MEKFLVSLFIVVLFVTSSLAASQIKVSCWEGIAAPCADEVRGVELGIGSFTQQVTGVSFNLIYSTNEIMTGVQFAPVNVNTQKIIGVQIGFFNRANYVRGLQLGFINYTKNMYGLQIGLVNFIIDGDVPAMVIANAKF